MERGIRYARLGDQSIAYDTIGEDDGVDVLLVPALVSHIELMWGDPGVARFLRRLSSFARVIVYDKLGTGLSDPITAPPSMEDRAREALTVLDATDTERAAVWGLFDGGATAAFLAASHPRRVTSLVLYGTHPVGPAVADAPNWEDGSWVERFERIESLADGWGDGRTLSFFSGTEVNVLERQFWSTFERASASPGMVRAMVRELGERDLRGLLDNVEQPTLVLHPARDTIHPLEQAQHIADRLADARLVPVVGRSRWPWSGDPDTVLAEMRAHLTGKREAPAPAATSAAVLFTDVVRSTELASALGDDRWRDRYDHLTTMTREQVAAHDGRYIKGTGDGALAVFDGPAQAIRCARAVVDRAPRLELRLRAGIHWGHIEQLHDGDVGSVAVHTAARICERAGAGEVLVSGVVRDLVAGSGLPFTDRGTTELAGLAQPCRLFAATAPGRSVELGDPGAGMRLRDRAAVAMTRRAPAITQLVSRLISSRRTSDTS